MSKTFLVACATTFLILGCKQEQKPADYAIVSGKVTNGLAADFSINSEDRTFTKSLKLSEDGSFIDTLDTEISNYVLYDGSNPIFLHVEPGNQLNISYDLKDFSNSLKITGEGSGINNYLIAKEKVIKENFGKAEDTYTLPEDQFKEKIKSITLTSEALMDDYSNIDDDFVVSEKRNLHYFYLRMLKDYENAYKYFTKDTQFKASDDLLKEYESIDFGNEADFKFSKYYRNIVNDHYQNEAKDLAQSDSLANDIAYLKTVGNIKNDYIKNGLLVEFANNTMVYSKDVDTFYDMYLKYSTNEKNNEVITEKYNKLTALSKGKPSPEFVDYKNYSGGTTSLSDLKGKYIYIDVWATWCGPCIQQIPALKEMEEKYHDKDIEFVSISIDKLKDYEKWKSMVENKSLAGVQLFADKDWKSSFVTDYSIQGIPRFILLDKEGNIVDANAPRPSNPKLETLFSELAI